VAGILSIPIVAFLGAAFIFLAKNYRGISRFQRTRIQYLFLAILIVWIGIGLNIVPALRPYAFDVIANILSAFVIAYAILRYQLLEINTDLRKMLESFVSIFTIGIGSTIVLYFFSKIANLGIETYIILFAAIISAPTILVLIPLRDRIQEYFQRTFFKTAYDG
jgi:hypothetical protein